MEVFLSYIDVRREQDYLGARQVGLQGAGHVKSIHVWHGEVKDDEIGAEGESLGGLNRFSSVFRLSADTEIWKLLENSSYDIPNKGIVVNDENIPRHGDKTFFGQVSDGTLAVRDVLFSKARYTALLARQTVAHIAGEGRLCKDALRIE
jgi:hypothetical protein